MTRCQGCLTAMVPMTTTMTTRVTTMTTRVTTTTMVQVQGRAHMMAEEHMTARDWEVQVVAKGSGQLAPPVARMMWMVDLHPHLWFV